MRLNLTPGVGMDELLDLPWQERLADWVDPPAAAPGHPEVGRRTVVADGTVVALRELSLADAERGNRLLRGLRHEGVPVAESLGVVSQRVDAAGEPLPAVLLTIRPPDTLTPVEVLASGIADAVTAVIDAAAGLLVQLHLVGFVWGDPSLHRMRFHLDAGRLSAILVDVGRGERREPLAATDRTQDLEAAAAAIADELGDEDVAARVADTDGTLPPAETAGGPHALRHEVRRRYRRLWHELTRDERLDGDDRTRSVDRLRRVNELGFDVDEVELTGDGEGLRLRLEPAVIEPGHHRRRLQRLTRLVVQENQARRLLEDIDRFRATLGPAPDGDGEPPSESTAAFRWLQEIFQPTVDAVPDDLRRPGQDDAEVFHEVLEHRYYLSERAGHDVGTTAAVDAYVADVLSARTSSTGAPGAAGTPELPGRGLTGDEQRSA